MNRSPDTDLRAYSGRALLVAAAISSSLHLTLALATPEWGSGRGLPMFRRPPLVVRLEMLDLTPRPPLPQGEGEQLDVPPSISPSHPSTEKGDGEEIGPPPKAQSKIASITSEIALFAMAETGGMEADSISAVNEEGKGDGSVEGLKGGGEGHPLSPSPALPVGEEAMGGAEAVEMWEVEEPPKQVAFVEPEYPAMARRMGVEGSVVVRYLVGRDGRVEQMAVLEGPELLRETSLRAVGQFTYEPVYHRGRRTKVWMRQVITFRLE
jgi:TonB family protein